jgi:phage shock protein E
MLNSPTNNIPQISADNVNKSLGDNANIILLDVRTPQEYSKGKISGSINLPVDQVASKIGQVIPDHEKKIYVYCLSGSRSSVAVETMIRLGYKNVFSMTSGLLAWRIKKYQMVN